MSNNNTKEKISDSHLEVILKIAVDAIISINDKGLIKTFNPAAEKLFGYSLNEVIGQNVSILMPKPYSHEHDSYIEKYKETRVKKIIGMGREVVAKHKDGNVFPIRLSVGEAEVDGELIFVGIIHDISEFKQQEQELKEHRDHLQTLVEQRTSELSLVNEKLRELANIDSLTNLPNRRFFDETLQKEIQRASRHKHPMSLLMCDIDFFKQYNDTYGHITGDECLVSVAECLEDSFKRASDFPARYGGEEFAVILPHTDDEDALSLSESFQKNLKALAIEHRSSDISEYVTISIGLVTVLPDQMTNANTIIKTADEALYKAKRNGRNRIEVLEMK
jgi:diguanylate cyclase (GGDEF)-like protein/PAS domain S-box-containing protein